MCLNPPVVLPHLNLTPNSLPQMMRPWGICPVSTCQTSSSCISPLHPWGSSTAYFLSCCHARTFLLAMSSATKSLQDGLLFVMEASAHKAGPWRGLSWSPTYGRSPTPISLPLRLTWHLRTNCTSADLLLFTISHLIYNSVKAQTLLPHVCHFLTSTSNSAQHWMEPSKSLFMK